MAVLLSAVMGTMLLQPTVSFAMDSQNVTSGTVTQWEWVWPDEADHKDHTLTIETSEVTISWDMIKDLLPKEIRATVEVEMEQEPQKPEDETGGSDSKDTTGEDTNTDKDTNTGGTTGETDDSNKTDDVNAGENADTESDTDEETNTGNTGDVTSSKDDPAGAGDGTPGEIETEPAGGVTDGAEISVNSQTAAALALPNTLYLVEGDGQNSDPSGDGGKQTQTIVIDVTWTEEDTVSDGDTLTANVSDKFEFNETLPKLQITVNLQEPTANPTFTVQYYANLVVADTGDDTGYLIILDTSGNGDGTGGHLPTNDNEGMKTKHFYLTNDGEIKTDVELTKVYTDNSFNFANYNKLSDINHLAKNENYQLVSVWVLKDGKDSESINESDWTIYNNLDGDGIYFTNSKDTADEDRNAILITDGSVIRLVYAPTTGSHTNAANFYDYDITEDRIHTYEDGNAQGINNPENYENYTSGDAKFAFGNANTGTGLDTQSWEGNTLNKANTNNKFQGCTYGIVSGLDEDRHLIYSEGIAAPNLFNEGAAKGKTSYENGQYSLQFNRSGDTYTLTAVNGADLEGLEKFTKLTQYSNGDKFWNNKTIWTNNFWPMDGEHNKDPHTGTYDESKRERFTGIAGEKTYPPSDDSIPHNNLFGMQFEVQFSLTEDYCGPLEYYFFGDDDMWAFLTDPEGNSRLVCDIGGVHSSVGEYVDLWDYIKKGSQGDYILSFFYTERGLSGSTCWMQFTLPSVSSVIPGQSTGNLTVKKDVVGNSNQEFTFTVGLKDEEGNSLINDYSCSDGDRISDGGTITLKNGQSITIYGLPVGTKYTITETEESGFVTSVNGTRTNVATGTISTKDSTETVTFTNTQLGSLTVAKTVSGTGTDTSKAFPFTVTLTDSNSLPVTGVFNVEGTATDVNGAALTTLTFDNNGTASFSLTHNQYIKIKGLPVGTKYTVTETDSDSYTVAYPNNNQSGKIGADAPDVTFTVTNTAPGNLTVKKSVVGEASADAKFTITITLNDSNINGKYGDVTFANGAATVTLKNGASVTATGLPAGIGYTVEETEASSAGYNVTYTGNNGTIAAGATAEVTVTNTVPTPDPKYGALTVTKHVTGNDASTSKEFTFTVELSDKTVTGTYGDMTFNGGKATFRLRDGESATATNLPAGVGYLVQEDADEAYAVSSEGAEGTIIQDSTAEASFVNRRVVLPPKTGDNSPIALWFALMAFSLCCAALLAGLRKRDGRTGR